MNPVKKFGALGCILVFLLAFGCIIPDKQNTKNDTLLNGTVPNEPTPSEQMNLSGLSNEVKTFKFWVTANQSKKSQYEQADVSLGAEPYLSESFFDRAFSNFSIKNVSVCPLIHGVCWHEENGSELTFSIEVDGVKFADRSVKFNSAGQVIGYDGPITDLPLTLIKESEARALAVSSNACNNDQLGPIMNDAGTTYYDYTGNVFWKFGVESRKPYCAAECIVNAMNKTVEPAWRCVMPYNG